MIEDLIIKKRRQLIRDLFSATITPGDKFYKETKVHVLDEILLEIRNLKLKQE
jgi:hypothetical protein